MDFPPQDTGIGRQCARCERREGKHLDRDGRLICEQCWRRLPRSEKP